MMNNIPEGAYANAPTEFRPSIISRRLNEFEQRMEQLLSQADSLGITLGSSSVLSPKGNRVEEARPPMGLYSEIFMSLDRLNDICSSIEQVIAEASR
ncbi:MAG: hypothetical protein HC888_01615 [Candidatus Competibacteraceae bacterium]|nr:hypothetical protein [Candidatus Competibacteraceae bacterium]